MLGNGDQHLSFYAREAGATLRAVGFGIGPRFNALCDLAAAGPFHIAFRPGLNTYKGNTSVELRLRAFRGNGPGEDG